ncbi:putative proteasome-type protease [Faunimonas pinastri]|uniref:Putative proteasome-type protease n=1 Tax=Faunimonas pinastri TaxID=1855383 RepID=A0A1H9JFD6_9HYPH|nr:proteasome-type protease [Faunimonas pinastri]SEQ85275.1 putative proteasome-type protease [Faunimonas pinastri]
MTYCVGFRLDRGIVFASDTRTNAGVDNIATFSKMHVWELKGDRVLIMLTAGNLAFTQSVVSILSERISTPPDPERPSLSSVTTMFQAARVVGAAIREVRRVDKQEIEDNPGLFSASFILGGQIGGEDPRLFQIYKEGNFIEATPDNPYFQIGEHKYGKPILGRVASPDMRLGVAAKLLLLSFDSTLRSNLSVGMPIDILIYRRDALEVSERRRIQEDDAYFKKLSTAWSEALRDAFVHIDEYEGADTLMPPVEVASSRRG